MIIIQQIEIFMKGLYTTITMTKHINYVMTSVKTR